MAPLKFSMTGYRFKWGLEALREGYASASAALTADIERIKSEAVTYEESEDWLGERDDDGNVLWEQSQILEMRQEVSEEALAALRKAFMLALYHHWERTIQTYMGRKPLEFQREAHKPAKQKSPHCKLREIAMQNGIHLHDRLDSMQRLANALKHNKGKPLQETWSDVLRPYARSQDPADWYEAIQLDESHIDLAFEIISHSGPAILPGRKPVRAFPSAPSSH